MKLDHFLASYTKVNSKWMEDLNIWQGAIRILEEKIGNNLFDLSCSDFLIDLSPEAREAKVKMNYGDVIKMKNFCTGKKAANITKRQQTGGEKIFSNYISDRRLVSRIYKELIKINTPKINNPVKKWAEDLNRDSSKEDIKMANRHMKIYSITLIIRETHIKTTMR